MILERLDHLVINVRDVERSAAWYARVLGMERGDFRAGGGVRTALRFGNQKLNLRPVDTEPQAWPTGAHAAAGSEDLCFITVQPVEQTVAHLRACGVDVELGPVEKQGALGPMTSVYCRDPDGNLIEISVYPA